jgi:hypothetical protein
MNYRVIGFSSSGWWQIPIRSCKKRKQKRTKKFSLPGASGQWAKDTLNTPPGAAKLRSGMPKDCNQRQPVILRERGLLTCVGLSSLYETKRALSRLSKPRTERPEEDVAMFFPQEIPHQFAPVGGDVIRSHHLTSTQPHGRTASAAKSPPDCIQESEEKTSPRDAHGISTSLHQQASLVVGNSLRGPRASSSGGAGGVEAVVRPGMRRRRE